MPLLKLSSTNFPIAAYSASGCSSPGAASACLIIIRNFMVSSILGANLRFYGDVDWDRPKSTVRSDSKGRGPFELRCGHRAHGEPDHRSREIRAAHRTGGRGRWPETRR